jgi:signal transduction histidine kinase
MPWKHGDKTHGVAFFQVWLNRLAGIEINTVSGNYQAWRDKFLKKRLDLASKIAFLWSLSYFFFYLSYSEDQKKLWLILGTAELFSIGICLALQKTQFGRSRSHLLFLVLGWSMTVYTQIGLSWNGYADFNFSIWTFTFLILAALIPVYWYLHFVVQLGVFSFYFVANAVLDAVPKSSVTEQIELAIALFWVCLICNLAVFLYEKIRKSELSARQNLESFVQTISAELRTPLVDNLQVFQQLWQQTGSKIAIARLTLETIAQNSDRQLLLIDSLLEKARNNLTKQDHFPNPFSLLKTVLGNLNLSSNPFATNKLTLNTVTASNFSGTEYQVWRHHFIGDRLRLVWWIAFGCTITLFALNCYEATLDQRTS